MAEDEPTAKRPKQEENGSVLFSASSRPSWLTGRTPGEFRRSQVLPWQSDQAWQQKREPRTQITSFSHRPQDDTAGYSSNSLHSQYGRQNARHAVSEPSRLHETISSSHGQPMSRPSAAPSTWQRDHHILASNPGHHSSYSERPGDQDSSQPHPRQYRAQRFDSTYNEHCHSSSSTATHTQARLRHQQPEKTQHRLRSYQQHLLRHALGSDNVIISLPTGSGKTRIAFHVMIEAQRRKPGRCAIFIAPSVPLVHQQMEAFEQECRELSVNFIRPVRHAGGKAPKDWVAAARSSGAMFLTPQLFLNALEQGKLDLSYVSVLILDECHHAKKEHPYSRLLSYYKSAPYKPKLMGLSAAPIDGFSPHDIAYELVDICTRFGARFHTIPRESAMYSDLKEAVSDPIVQNVRIVDTPEQSEVRKDLVRLANFKANELLRPTRLGFTQFDLEDNANLGVGDNEPDPLLRRAWNLISAVSAALLAGSFDVATNHMELHELQALLGPDIIRRFDEVGTADMTELILLLRDEVLALDQQGCHDLRALVFVRERQQAVAVSKMLNMAFANDPEFQQRGLTVKSKPFLGHACRKTDDRMTQAQQKEVMAEFRRGHLHVLVATSIAEEGVDVPACNLVVRMHGVDTASVNIQSRGRARNKRSRYIRFYRRADEFKHMQDLDHIEMSIIKLCEALSKDKPTWELQATRWDVDEPAPGPASSRTVSRSTSASNTRSASLSSSSSPKPMSLMPAHGHQAAVTVPTSGQRVSLSGYSLERFEETSNYAGDVNMLVQRQLIEVLDTKEHEQNGLFIVLKRFRVRDREMSVASDALRTKKLARRHAAFRILEALCMQGLV